MWQLTVIDLAKITNLLSFVANLLLSGYKFFFAYTEIQINYFSENIMDLKFRI